MAQSILEPSRLKIRRIIMVTDGKPTTIIENGEVDRSQTLEAPDGPAQLAAVTSPVARFNR